MDLTGSGLVDWAAIEDRTRNVRTINTWDDPAEILAAVGQQYKEDFWADQPCNVEVWIEKDALVGVIDAVLVQLSFPGIEVRRHIVGDLQRLHPPHRGQDAGDLLG